MLLLPEKLQVIQEYRFLLFSVFVILMLLFRPRVYSLAACANTIAVGDGREHGSQLRCCPARGSLSASAG